jgi:lipoprotein-anchoring transpeptidase ErfK/SrfK
LNFLRIHKKIFEWSMIAVISLGALFLGFLLSYQQVYAGKIYKNVYFGTIDLSGKTQKQAERILKNTFDDLMNEDFVITSGPKQVKAKFKDSGLSFSSDEIINDLFKVGRGNNFWQNLTKSSVTLVNKTRLEARPTVDEDKYSEFISIAVKQLNYEPIDASLSIADGAVKYIPSQDGQIVDTSHLIDQIIETVTLDSKRITLDSTTQSAKIQNTQFDMAKSQAEAYLNKSISFTYQGKTYNPSQKEIGAWIVIKDNTGGTASAILDESNIKAYLNKIAANFEVTKRDRKINDNGDVVQEGRQGLYLDKDTVIKNLLGAINNQTISLNLPTYTVDPKEILISIIEGVETGRYEGKYIDVNLSTQRFCLVDSTALLDCFATSTGKASTPTPTGSYAITRKNPMGWAPNPGVWMPWFQEFKAGGYGIHELVLWPNGSHEPITNLGQKVSHGCVRLAPGTAEMVYNWTDIGTPVYIHN